MARKKVKLESRLKSWADVDETLRLMGECERALSGIESNMNEEISSIKDRYSRLAAPVHERLGHLSADVCQFVTEHRGDMEGKTKELNFGRTGFRISSKLKYNKGVKVADAVAALLKLKLPECVKTTQTVIVDRLKQQPLEVLDKVGAYLDKRDEFWFETRQELLQPASGPEEQT